jgi:sulfite reductase alpha subunit-like flavoprotein
MDIEFPELKQLKTIKLMPNVLSFEFFENGQVVQQEDRETSGIQTSIDSHRFLTENVLEITLTTPLEFLPGDVVEITPKNEEAIVEELLNYFEGEEKSFRVQGKSIPAHLCRSRVVRDVFYELDIHSFPKKQYFRHMAEFALGVHRERLLILSSPSGKDVYQKLREKRPSLLQLFKWFDLQVPLEFFLEHTPSIAPRYYSCSRFSPKFTFAFNIVKESNFKGLCSNWLLNRATSNPNTPFPIALRKSPVEFRVPELGKPLFIANGTGVAPMLGFIEQLVSSGRESTLLYGHRTKEDNVYKEELLVHTEKGFLELVECLSREESENKYVQDALGKVTEIFTRPILVCGYIKLI